MKKINLQRTPLHQIILFLFFSTAFVACQQTSSPEENPNALKEPFRYKNEQVGWAVEVPAGWEILSEEAISETNQKGESMFEETYQMDFNTDNLINMISFQKGESNVFMVTAEPFWEEYIGEWREANTQLRDILTATYNANGMSATASEISTAIIDDVEFLTYEIHIDNELGINILKQTMYTAHHNGYDFGISLTYTDSKTKEEMLDICHSSNLIKREQPDSVKSWYAEMDSIYTNAINKGDLAFENKRYGEAMFWYRKAGIINPLDNYVSVQLSICENVADEQHKMRMVELELAEQFNNVLSKGDEHFSNQNYEDAETYYQRALTLQPGNTHAREKIAEIEKMVD